MANLETRLQQLIRLALGQCPSIRLFRNNVGSLRDSHNRLVTFGLAKGSGDLIGWKTIKITPEMVGSKVAVFLSIEVKTPVGNVRPDQRCWLEAVNAAGGIAIVARSEEDVTALLQP